MRPHLRPSAGEMFSLEKPWCFCFLFVCLFVCCCFGEGVPNAEMPSVTFLQYFVLFFGENTSKILQDLGKYCFFSKFIMYVYWTKGKNTVFYPKYFFSALKILQTFLQGWHPCKWHVGCNNVKIVIKTSLASMIIRVRNYRSTWNSWREWYVDFCQFWTEQHKICKVRVDER